MIELRPEVQAFAEAMELKLRQNDHKGGWKREGHRWLLLRAHEELTELFKFAEAKASNDTNSMMESISPSGGWRGAPDLRPKILQECTDVANFAMMIADNSGSLDVSKLSMRKEVV